MYTRANTKWAEQLKRYFPMRLRKAVERMPADTLANATELRFGVGRVTELFCGCRKLPLTLHQEDSVPLALDAAECRHFFNMITSYSPYAHARTLEDGFITLPNGCRVGIAGVFAPDASEGVSAYRCSSFAVRIAKDIPNVSRGVIPHIMRGDTIRNTLILSPPGYGKTTYLRDIARILNSEKAKRVCIVDERMEIAGFYDHHPQFDVGASTDVVSGCQKAYGMMKALRVLNPEVMITDEIGSREDAQALREIANCGVAVIASAHGQSVEEVRSRPNIAQMLREELFDVFVRLPPPWDIEKDIEIRFWEDVRRKGAPCCHAG